ncbi:MAG: polysaccharide deacetylase family protein [Waterburya sp.]
MKTIINKVQRKLRRVNDKVQKKFSSQGLILMYHRVAEEDIDPWSLRVTPKNFAEHLQVIQQHTQPISLKELAQAHQEGNICDRSVAITFDDGYANNLHQAKPLLEQYQIPATVFVATEYLAKPREFWWDELERIILQTKQLPGKLSLTIHQQEQQWELGTASIYSKSEAWLKRNLPAWNAQPGSRLRFYYELWAKLQPLTPHQRQPLLEQITAWANYSFPEPRTSHRPMTIAELSEIERGGIIDLGGHTVSHPLLSEQSLGLQREEIQQSKLNLEKLLNHPVHSFAYPFGAYSPETLPLVEEAGFNYACSTLETTVWRKSDRYLLPRFEVQNWNKVEFERKLLNWLHS